MIFDLRRGRGLQPVSKDHTSKMPMPRAPTDLHLLNLFFHGAKIVSEIGFSLRDLRGSTVSRAQVRAALKLAGTRQGTDFAGGEDAGRIEFDEPARAISVRCGSRSVRHSRKPAQHRGRNSSIFAPRAATSATCRGYTLASEYGIICVHDQSRGDNFRRARR